MLPILFISELFILMSVMLMHLAKKNAAVVSLYLLQSSAVALILFILAAEEQSLGLLISAALTLLVKAVIAPWFFFKLIREQKLKLAVSTYLTTPLTLLALLLLTLLAQSEVFFPLITLFPAVSDKSFVILMSAILISLFLIINRKGVLSQIVGVLSLENGIVALGSFMGIKQTLALELGIAFDIFIWIFIAVVFMAKIHKHFGTLNITAMKNLVD
ncbi:MAG: hypothetical protein HY602_00940 [Parcubacteria group bacterium]|nr:hypothetical protein [Parcubacteria group bacterium]